MAWRALAVVAAAWLAPAGAAGQPPPAMPPTPVRYTEARELDLRRSVELTGPVGSRRSSLVASEVEGIVERLAAREGDRVARGAPLVRLRRTSVELRGRAVEGQLKEALARRQLAEASLERARGLFEQLIISQQQLDDAVSEYEAWQGRVAQLEADAARLADDLERTTVRAPFGGVVVAEHCAEGEWLAGGAPVVELVDTSDLEVTLQVPEGYFAGLHRDAEVGVRIEALGAFDAKGVVRAVVPQASGPSRTFPVKVGIANPDGRIGIGMLARVSLPVGEPERSIIVPKDAVVQQGNESFLFVLDGDNKVERRAVRPGSSAGAWVAVGGVAAGDRVITRGNERVFPGQAVDPQPVEYELP